ncbi:MAG: hypothetical protein JJ992_21470, partial [Planctomycetes bacterium]|nr:hypothetical protein [Planctomycetota bacterium]
WSKGKELPMQQNDLNRAVARATGETVSRIKRIGFLLADPETETLDPDDETLGPRVIDWDAPAETQSSNRELSRVAS